MSHDRGCYDCGADTMSDKRACFARRGQCCVKAHLFKSLPSVTAPSLVPVIRNSQPAYNQIMKIYLAGPMRGISEFNFPTFHAAAAKLREAGHYVFNPAEKDVERHGTDISKGNVLGCEHQAAKEHGFNLRVALGDDLMFICAEADAIALLPGWENSKGARAEYATAMALGLEVMVL